MTKSSHRYTAEDIRERFTAAIGKTAGELDTKGILSASTAHKNKGRIGAVIEQSVLGYPADNRQEPDLIIDGTEWELKTTGLIAATRSDSWRAKEPVSITAVSPNRIVGEEFSTSTFWHKAERLLIVYYLYVKPGKGMTASYASFEIKGFDQHEWNSIDRKRLEADWTTIRDYVRTALAGDKEALLPGLSTLINPRLLYLDTSPKYPNAPRFRLKSSLVTQMARERLDDNLKMIPDNHEIGSSDQFNAYLGNVASQLRDKTLAEYATLFNLPFDAEGRRDNKALAEQVIVRLFTGQSGKISQVPLFVKAGFQLKTVVLTVRGGRTEDMKLSPAIDFEEMCDPDTEFEESSFASIFLDSTIIVAVFKEPYNNCPLHACHFQGFKRFWLGKYIDDAQKLWDQMRELIFSGALIDKPICDKNGNQRFTPKTGIPMSAPNWPKSRDGVLFVRGSGNDATNKPVTVNGVKMYYQNLWIRGTDIAIHLGTTNYIE
ncbi:MutH/Sau3AI family endonuclease [Senegalimassilia anaerobia]